MEKTAEQLRREHIALEGDTHGKNKWAILFTVLIMTFMVCLDSTVVTVALPVMQKELGVGLDRIQLVSSVYLLATCVAMLPFGRLGDVRGKVNVFQLGVIVFSVGSLLCGLSASLEVLILARIVQGVGCAAAMANNMGIITESFPACERGRAMGILATFVALGMMCGPVLGGMLVASFPWESIFLINLPIGVISFIVGLYTLPHVKPEACERPMSLAEAARRCFANSAFTINLVCMLIVFVGIGASEFILPFYFQDAHGFGSDLSGLLFLALPMVKGVRTESWTAGRSGLEVRMYSREKVELFLLATEDGMGPTAAAKFAGVSVGAAKKWATGHLPHSYTGARCRIGARKPPRKEASLGPDKSIYAPPATGPLAGLNEDQIENLLLRAVLADLKAEGWDPASISNRSKCELGERLRRATALPLRSITGFLRISKSSYEYWRPRVAAPRDRDADIRDRVVRIFREGSGCWGYRTVWARLRREGVRASEKRVARVMREEGLEVVYNKRRARGYSSYAGEVSKAPENLVNRRFRADEPNRLWLTDITEFRLPGGEKVYLSPIVDCFDGMPVAWSIGLHPDKRLANSSLLKACAARPAGARTTIHSDRGGRYRWPEWIGICEENGLVRSMSAKGCSPDNSACEGFFGRLKNEFFHYRDWEGVTAEEFMGRLEAYLVYYREERIKKSLGWLSPMEYRRKLGYA